MIKFNSLPPSFRFSALLMLFSVFQGRNPAFSQPVNPITTALGGASVTMVNGLDAIGTNPAGLFLQQKGEKFSILVYQPSFWMAQPSLLSGNASRTTAFDEMMNPFSISSALPTSSDTAQNAISGLIIGNRNLAQYSFSSDLLIAAAALRFETKTIGIFARRRFQQDARQSKSWFQTALPTTDPFDRNLELRYRSWTELGLAFSGEWSVISGLNPNFNSLVFGFAPKLIIGGTYFSGLYREEIHGGASPYAFRSAEIRSAGAATALEQQLLSGSAVPEGVFRSDLFTNSGIGAGFDLGMSYVVPGGEDFSLFNTNAPAGYLPGLKFSLAVRDLGLVKWTQNTTFQTALIDSTSLLPTDGDAPARMFTAQPGAFAGFLKQNGSATTVLNRTSNQTESFVEELAPTLQTGFSAANKWITLAVESTFRVTGLALDAEAFQGNFGLEIRPFQWLPLRGGLFLQRELPLYFSGGMGLNFRYFQADAGFMWFKDPTRNDARNLVASSYRIKIRI